MNKLFVIAGIVIALLGVVFTFASHDIHNSVLGTFLGHHDGAEHDEDGHEEGSHDIHKVIGIVVTLAGIGISGAGWKLI